MEKSDLAAHQPRFFTIPVSILFRLALVVLLLAFGQADFRLDTAFQVMQIEGDQRVTGALDLADQPVDLIGVQQQFARPGRVGFDVCGGFCQRRDMHAENEHLAVLDDNVGFLDVGASGTDRLDFPAFQNDARLELFFDEVIVERFFVGDDAHEIASATLVEERAGVLELVDSTGFGECGRDAPC